MVYTDSISTKEMDSISISHIDPSDPKTVPKYVDMLPIPYVLRPENRNWHIPYYEVRMKQIKQRLHRYFPETTVWGYEGSYPGPIIEAERNRPIAVKWINSLPNKHLLPVDHTVHGCMNTPDVRTVVHLHGGNVPAVCDGHPEAWFTRKYRETGPAFSIGVYYYPNNQEAAMLWYHDHALGITRLNVYAGLAGLYYIRDKHERSLNLPKGKYEIPLVIQDRSFNKDGSLFYPSQPEPPVPGVDPSIVPEFFGNTILVNGKVWPYLNVEPRKYRFRILNGSNSRFYRLRFSTGQPFYQIGTDVGLLERPVEVTTITLAPAERADVIVDFSGYEGKKILLLNDAPTPFPDGDPADPDTTGQIMQFRVGYPYFVHDNSRIPHHLCRIEWLSESSAVKVRDQELVESVDEYGRPILLLNNKRWDDPIDDITAFQSIEIWRFINLTVDTHPIHLHLVRFQILDRQPFNVDHYKATGEVVFTGPKVKPDLNERGWKDTVRANPGEITRIIARFGDYTGIYPWHCHILEHEDHEMMRPYEVRFE